MSFPLQLVALDQYDPKSHEAGLLNFIHAQLVIQNLLWLFLIYPWLKQIPVSVIVEGNSGDDIGGFIEMAVKTYFSTSKVTIGFFKGVTAKGRTMFGYNVDNTMELYQNLQTVIQSRSLFIWLSFCTFSKQLQEFNEKLKQDSVSDDLLKMSVKQFGKTNNSILKLPPPHYVKPLPHPTIEMRRDQLANLLKQMKYIVSVSKRSASGKLKQSGFKDDSAAALRLAAIFAAKFANGECNRNNFDYDQCSQKTRTLKSIMDCLVSP